MIDPNTLSATFPGTRSPARPRAPLARLARRAVLGRLEQLSEGRLELIEGSERHCFGSAAGQDLCASVEVRDGAFWTRVAFGGSVGAAESYADGQWETDDLVSLIRLFARDRRLDAGLESGWASVRGAWEGLRRRLMPLSEPASRRDIAAHYDLGDELFSVFLDSSMTYSSALFPSPGASLEKAQRLKLDRVCRVLGLRPEHEVLEIGSGWGSFALHAAREHGCRVTTTTISRRQREWVERRIAESGLGDRVRVLDLDYRRLPSLGRRFDRVVSIEMIEAVGEAHLDRFLEVARSCLADDGALLIQAILMADRFYARYRRSTDFIQRLIFPGSFLPSLADLLARSARVTDLAPVDLFDLTPHYALTLERWRERFTARAERVAELGYPESFRRLWEYYFCYCEGGFREGITRDAQIVLAAPGFEGFESLASGGAKGVAR